MGFDVVRKVQENAKSGAKYISIPNNFCTDFDIETGEEMFWSKEFFLGVEVWILVDEKRLDKIKKKLREIQTV